MFSALWKFLVGAVASLVGGNSEARNDFVAINNALDGMVHDLMKRCDSLQLQVDELRSKLIEQGDDMYELRMENRSLTTQLAQAREQNERDAVRIQELERKQRQDADHIAELRQQIAALKAELEQHGGGLGS